jgi:hypothetical protein
VSPHRALLAVVVAGALAIGGFLAWQFVMSDKCLDGGGAWNYADRRCDTEPEKQSRP